MSEFLAGRGVKDRLPTPTLCAPSAFCPPQALLLQLHSYITVLEQGGERGVGVRPPPLLPHQSCQPAGPPGLAGFPPWQHPVQQSAKGERGGRKGEENRSPSRHPHTWESWDHNREGQGTHHLHVRRVLILHVVNMKGGGVCGCLHSLLQRLIGGFELGKELLQAGRHCKEGRANTPPPLTRHTSFDVKQARTGTGAQGRRSQTLCGKGDGERRVESQKQPAQSSQWHAPSDGNGGAARREWPGGSDVTPTSRKGLVLMGWKQDLVVNTGRP